jgi:hypothetical protein
VAGVYGLAPVVGILVDRAIASRHRRQLHSGRRPRYRCHPSGTTGEKIAALLLLGVGWSFTNVAVSAPFASTVADETRASAQGAVDALAKTSSERRPPS